MDFRKLYEHFRFLASHMMSLMIDYYFRHQLTPLSHQLICIIELTILTYLTTRISSVVLISYFRPGLIEWESFEYIHFILNLRGFFDVWLVSLLAIYGLWTLSMCCCVAAPGEKVFIYYVFHDLHVVLRSHFELFCFQTGSYQRIVNSKLEILVQRHQLLLWLLGKNFRKLLHACAVVQSLRSDEFAMLKVMRKVTLKIEHLHRLNYRKWFGEMITFSYLLELMTFTSWIVITLEFLIVSSLIFYFNPEPLFHFRSALLTIWEAILTFISLIYLIRTVLVWILWPFQSYFYYRALNFRLVTELERVYFRSMGDHFRFMGIRHANREFLFRQSRSIVHLLRFNRVFSVLYILLFGFIFLCSIFFMVRVLNYPSNLFEILLSGAMSVSFVSGIVILIVPLSRLSSSIHDVAKPLMRVQLCLRRDYLADKLSFDSLIARLMNSRHRYGFAYKQYSTFTSATFLNIIAFYKGIVIIVMKMKDYDLFS